MLHRIRFANAGHTGYSVAARQRLDMLKSAGFLIRPQPFACRHSSPCHASRAIARPRRKPTSAAACGAASSLRRSARIARRHRHDARDRVDSRTMNSGTAPAPIANPMLSTPPRRPSGHYVPVAAKPPIPPAEPSSLTSQRSRSPRFLPSHRAPLRRPRGCRSCAPGVHGRLPHGRQTEPGTAARGGADARRAGRSLRHGSARAATRVCARATRTNDRKHQ
jgi:hypothetical protein